MLRIELVKPYSLAFREAEKPKPGAGQALLKVHYAGVCGSDIQMYHGQHKYMTYPVVIGHEVAATVAELGNDVAGFVCGDKATVEPQVYCGQCHPCSIGRFNVCENLAVLGVHRDGFCQEFVAVDARYLHKCPAAMRTEDMALVEPLAVGVGAVKRAGEYRGANVVVVGAGTIGNLAAQAAKALGAEKVLITDIAESKLELARRMGIELAVNTDGKDLGAVIARHFGARKADIIIDCAATKASLLSILGAARRSSSIVVTGNFKTPVEIELPVLQRQEITLIGHMMYVREDYSDAIRFLNEGRVRLEGLITRLFPAGDAENAFSFIDANAAETMKVLLKF